MAARAIRSIEQKGLKQPMRPEQLTPHVQPHPGRSAINPMMDPRSVVIIGMSAKADSPSQMLLHNLLSDGYAGDLHLVGRKTGDIRGFPCVSSLDEVPFGLDLAILSVPGSTVRETVEACIARGVRSAVCFASGFAETGEAGRREQEEIGRIAREGGLALLGPNCVGYYNYVRGFQAMLVVSTPIVRITPEEGPGLAVITQSGGMGHHIAQTLKGRGVPVSYMVTTGNEAHLGLTDFISYFLDDANTGGVVIYAEQIRRPVEMLDVAKAARQRGKWIVVFHPGRSNKAQAATATHTGSLAGDHAVMRSVMRDAGVAMAETLEETLDLSELLLRYPAADGRGLGVVTTSGAITAVAADYCEAIGLELPALSASSAQFLREMLPEFTGIQNPLDLGSLPAWKPELLQRATEAMLADPAFGSILLSNPYTEGGLGAAWAAGAVRQRRDKPLIYVVHDESVALSDAVAETLCKGRMVVMRSPERAMRALARVTELGAGARKERVSAVGGQPALTELGRGVQPEWVGKQILAKLGVAVPDGALARSPEEAERIAERIGFPIALKAQAAALSHKSDVGAVLLNIADKEALGEAYATLTGNIARYDPKLSLDGVLVEKMSGPGIELFVGARRDPAWGPVLVIGMGGIWVEALEDTRLLPIDLSAEEIVAEFRLLKGAKLLAGYRGKPPTDIAAAAAAAVRVASLMRGRPEIGEIEINPLMAFADGQGACALDVLITVS